MAETFQTQRTGCDWFDGGLGRSLGLVARLFRPRDDSSTEKIRKKYVEVLSVKTAVIAMLASTKNPGWIFALPRLTGRSRSRLRDVCMRAEVSQNGGVPVPRIVYFSRYCDGKMKSFPIRRGTAIIPLKVECVITAIQHLLRSYSPKEYR